MFYFTCPKCKNTLEKEKNEIQCPLCDFRGQKIENIVDLRCGRLDYYFNPIPRPLMKDLVQPISRDAWPQIIRRFMAAVKDNPDWIDNLVVDGRYAWKLFLNLPEEAVLLDLGCGLGNLVHNLAPHAAKIYAMDLTWERLEFARLRFSLFNQEDEISLIAGGDGTFLPFPDNSLDCVTLSGVLEWIPDNPLLWREEGNKLYQAWSMVAAYFGTKNPRKIQIAFLKEIRRTLKPSGQLFVGIENRFNYEYFTGRPDHHSGLKGASLLPRFLANLYSIAKKHRPYRTYTHSLSGYRRLFHAAGFEGCKFIGLLDGYSKLNTLLPYDFPKLGWRPEKKGSAKTTIKEHRRFVPAYGIIAAEKNTDVEPLLARLLQRITEENPSLLESQKFTLFRFQVTGKDKAVIAGTIGSTEIIIKLPFTEQGIRGERENARILNFLHSNKHDSEFDIPRPLAAGSFQAIPYFLETRCSGKALADTLKGADRSVLIKQVYTLWRAILEYGGGQRLQLFDGAFFDHHVIKPAKIIRTVTAYPAKLDSLVDNIESSLRGTNLLCGLTHGDFSVSNIRARNNKISGLIDWETSNKQGLAVLDIINYLDSVERAYSSERDIVNTLGFLLRGSWPHADEEDHLNSAFDLSNVNENGKISIIYIYWMNHIRILIWNGLLYNRIAISEKIDCFLELI